MLDIKFIDMGGLSNSIAPSESTHEYALNPNRKIIYKNRY